MSILKTQKLSMADGTIRGTPVNIQTFSVPYCTASKTQGYISDISGFTTSNTAFLYSFQYKPVSKDSYIVWTAPLEQDANSNPGPEHLVIFVNDVPYSNGYFYRRNSGHEPMNFNQSGVFVNNTGSALTFSIRTCSGSGWISSIGMAYDGLDQTISNTITIFEVQK
jgi:hypothetical protein